jgi:anti-sigma B factor antagonist
MPIDFSRTDNGDVSTLHVAGTLDITTRDELSPIIDTLVEQKSQHVVVDLAGLELIDSSGVATLVGLYKRVRAQGGKVEVSGARAQPLAIFKLLRMDRVVLVRSARPRGG